MHPRRIILATAVVATLGTLTAVTIPAFAGTDRTPEPDPALVPPTRAEPGPEPPPEVVAALRRDLGLSQDQALARLGMADWAAQTVAALRSELGSDRYAGAWLTTDAEQLRVAVTDLAAAEAVRATGAEAALARYSARELAEFSSTLEDNVDPATYPVTGWYADIPSNQVVVLAPHGEQSAAQAFVAASGLSGDAVRVAVSDEQPRLLADLRGGDAYFIEDTSRCSVGFSVVGPAGGAGFVTAGHCALAGLSTTGFDGTPQGEFVAASFPGVGLGGPDDWAVVAVNDDWVPQPVVNDFEGGLLPVAGTAPAPVGATVCKSGSTTGVSCGLVLAKEATVVYPEGVVTGLTRTNVCAEPGDSGGAWLSGDQAQGLTSGGSGNCAVGGITFFQPLDEVLEVTDLTLVTTGQATG